MQASGTAVQWVQRSPRFESWLWKISTISLDLEFWGQNLIFCQLFANMASHLLDIAAAPPTASKKRRLNDVAPVQYTVDYRMHAEHRAKVVQHLKANNANISNLNNIIVLQGGVSKTRNETDHELLFRQESSFHYLFGVREPDCYGTINIDTGTSMLYVPRLPSTYVIFMGEIHSLEWFQERYGVDQVHYVDELDADLSVAKPHSLYLNHGPNTDSGAYAQPAQFKGLEKHQQHLGALYRSIVECRMIKTTSEMDILRFVNDASSDAHVEVMRRARPGMAEFQLESLFRHFSYFRYGCRLQAYTSICGCGPNASVLHYGHAGAPNDFVLKDNDMCLLDMGGEYHCYDADITCSFPANGIFTEPQRFVFETVQQCQERVMQAMKPNVPWIDMHTLSYRVLLERFVARGVLVDDIDTMLLREHNIAAYFMPHGLGHMIGLDTHDVGGIPWGMEASRPTELGYKSLRCLQTLQEGYVVTVEPGCYFIDYLMDQLITDPKLKTFVKDVDKLNAFRNFGGVRLEDCILVTKDGIENLTNCPRTVEDVENVMNGSILSREGLATKPYYRSAEGSSTSSSSSLSKE